MSNDLILIGYDRLVKETDDAWLVEIEDIRYWLPKSQCELDEVTEVVEIPEWIIEREGIIVD